MRQREKMAVTVPLHIRIKCANCRHMAPPVSTQNLFSFCNLRDELTGLTDFCGKFESEDDNDQIAKHDTSTRMEHPQDS